ncbi:hypothetical protein J6590_003846 [Homalodisca vitripennis]|nr:hypothetical protein J6590_003846 [Homalodisca vitripennis]
MEHSERIARTQNGEQVVGLQLASVDSGTPEHYYLCLQCVRNFPQEIRNQRRSVIDASLNHPNVVSEERLQQQQASQVVGCRFKDGRQSVLKDFRRMLKCCYHLS